MTLTAVARQAGLSRSFYTQVEHARQTISVDRAFILASILGVEMTELSGAFPPAPYAALLTGHACTASDRSRSPWPQRAQTSHRVSRHRAGRQQNWEMDPPYLRRVMRAPPPAGTLAAMNPRSPCPPGGGTEGIA
jgi:transcriptional regulator with XRE-family HTH domain